MKRLSSVAWMALGYPFLAAAQAPDAAVAPARMVITAGHFYSHEPRQLMPDELIVTQDFERLTVTNLTPLYGTPLELFFLVDSCSSCEAGSQFADLSRFINSQTENTKVGVAYIQDGRLEISQTPVADHAQAAKALNTPSGGRPANPFPALGQLIEAWRPDGARHVAIVISNGIDPTPAAGLLDATADAVIEQAQRAGVMVYAIYHPSANYAETEASKIYEGQIQLAHIAAETGGEAYVAGFGPLPSWAPYLGDLWDHLGNQYLLEFLAKPGPSAGALQGIEVKSGSTDVDIMAPWKVLVPALKSDKELSGAGQ